MAKKISTKTITSVFSAKKIIAGTGMLLAASAAIAVILTVFFVAR